MKDMMNIVYDALIADEFIKSNIGDDQVEYYRASENLDYSKPFIVIDSFGGPQDTAYFGSDKELSLSFKFQINIESPNRLLTKKLASAVKTAMLGIGFFQVSGGLDEYFEETKRFVDARRYRKNTEMNDTNY